MWLWTRLRVDTVACVHVYDKHDGAMYLYIVLPIVCFIPSRTVEPPSDQRGRQWYNTLLNKVALNAYDAHSIFINELSHLHTLSFSCGSGNTFFYSFLYFFTWPSIDGEPFFQSNPPTANIHGPVCSDVYRVCSPPLPPPGGNPIEGGKLK